MQTNNTLQSNNTTQKITRTKPSRFENETVPTRQCKKSIRLERKQARKSKHFPIEGSL